MVVAYAEVLASSLNIYKTILFVISRADLYFRPRGNKNFLCYVDAEAETSMRISECHVLW